MALENTALVSNLVPGPSGTTMRYVIYRSWGITSADFAKGWLVSSAFNNMLVLAMPVVGAILVIGAVRRRAACRSRTRPLIGAVRRPRRCCS